MMESKQTHCGQHRRYGDFFRVWEIQTDQPKEEVLEYCFTKLIKRRPPDYAEWSHAIRYPDGARFNDAAYYFGGWHKLEKIEGGYKFTVCEPYAD